MDLGLVGRVAIVAAASKGLGRTVAEELSHEGASVAICARSAKKPLRKFRKPPAAKRSTERWMSLIPRRLQILLRPLKPASAASTFALLIPVGLRLTHLRIPRRKPGVPLSTSF
jgi:NAD(P)-dependent dehydrogenase (short-subunit alcohol dehydrogenase family)